MSRFKEIVLLHWETFLPRVIDRITHIADDGSYFTACWSEPEGGIERYLCKFLAGDDTVLNQIAAWTVVQLLENGGKYQKTLSVDVKISELIKSQSQIIDKLTELSRLPTPTPTPSIASNDDDEEDADLSVLAKRALDLISSI